MEIITLAKLVDKVKPIFSSDESILVTVEIIPVSLNVGEQGIRYVFGYMTDFGNSKRGEFVVVTDNEGKIQNIGTIPNVLTANNRENVAELTKLFDMRIPNPFVIEKKDEAV